MAITDGRSPLLVGTRLIIAPQGSKMFQFPWFGRGGQVYLFHPVGGPERRVRSTRVGRWPFHLVRISTVEWPRPTLAWRPPGDGVR